MIFDNVVDIIDEGSNIFLTTCSSVFLANKIPRAC